MSNAAQGFATAKSFDLSAVDESSFNEPISGRALGVGDHAVTLTSIEALEGKFGPQLKLTWTADNGGEIREFMNLKMDSKREPGKQVISFRYRKLASLAVSEAEVDFKTLFFLKQAPAQTKLYDGLRGMKGTITVSKGKKGVDIVSANGGYMVVDVETGMAPETLEVSEFMSFEDAAQAVKDKALHRAFNNVSDMRATAEEVEANEKALRAYLASATSSKDATTIQQFNAI